MPHDPAFPDAAPLDPAPSDDRARKRSRRWWLLAPYALVILLLIGWSVGWFVVKNQIERRLDQQAQALRRSGWTVSLGERRFDGFPFRLRLRYGTAQVATPSGWALSVPGFEAQAYLHAADHWVLLAPRGLTFVRPKGGPVAVSGQTIRASLAGLRQPLWRVVLEGRELKFAPTPEARPFALASADLLQLYFQPSGAADEARWLFRLENAAAAPNALLGALSRGKPVGSRVEGRLTELKAWSGIRPAAAARAWSNAGGAVQLDRGELDAGGVKVRVAEPSALTLDREGRLKGALPLEVSPALATLGALAGVDIAPEAATRAAQVLSGRQDGDVAHLTVHFEAGATTLGPVRIGPAPALF